MPYCPECDTTVAEGSYCPACGTALIQPVKHEHPRDEGDAGETDPTEGAGDQSDTAADTTVPVADDSADETDYFAKGPIGFAVTFPLADGWGPILITAGLLLFGWLLIPYVLVYGYAYRLGRGTIRGDPTPPAYEDWMGLLRDGALYVVVLLPIAIVGLIVVGIPFALAISLDSFGLGFLAFVLYLATIYIGMGVIPTFMATGSVTETYWGGRFLEFVGTMTYLKALALTVVVSVVASMVIGTVALILMLTIIGILLVFPLYLLTAPFLLFLPFLLFGYYYREAVDAGEVAPMADESRIEADL